jgi:hypothetical protein
MYPTDKARKLVKSIANGLEVDEMQYDASHRASMRKRVEELAIEAGILPHSITERRALADIRKLRDELTEILEREEELLKLNREVELRIFDGAHDLLTPYLDKPLDGDMLSEVKHGLVCLIEGIIRDVIQREVDYGE